jgi:hypothetical protein
MYIRIVHVLVLLYRVCVSWTVAWGNWKNHTREMKVLVSTRPGPADRCLLLRHQVAIVSNLERNLISEFLEFRVDEGRCWKFTHINRKGKEKFRVFLDVLSCSQVHVDIYLTARQCIPGQYLLDCKAVHTRSTSTWLQGSASQISIYLTAR